MNDSYGLLVVFFMAMFVGFVFMDLQFFLIGLVLQIMYFGFSKGNLIGEFFHFIDALPLFFLLVGSIYAFLGLAFYFPYRLNKNNLEHVESLKAGWKIMGVFCFGLCLLVLYSGFSKNDLKGEIFRVLNILPIIFLGVFVLFLIFLLLFALLYKFSNCSKDNKKD